MKYKQLLLLLMAIILFFEIGLSHASIFDKKLQVYECNNLICDNSCKKINGLFFEFKVNKDKNFVLLNIFRDGSSAGNNALKNCSIVDSKNWRCEDSSFYGLNQHSMTNQVYIGMSLFTVNNKTTQTNICAR